MRDAFVRIDVAFAKKKRLPVVICTWEGERLGAYLSTRVTALEPEKGVAALKPEERVALGTPPDDAIGVPRVG